jgi:hypothetical protein
VRFFPTFDFARAETTLEVVPGHGVVARCGTSSLALACPGIELTESDGGWTRGTLRVVAGEEHWFCLGPALEPGEYQADLSVPTS